MYEGTLEARDNFGANGPANRDGVLARGPVWAVLYRDPSTARTRDEAVELLIVSELQNRRMVLHQNRASPELTSVSAITALDVRAGAIGECRRCVASFLDPAPRIVLLRVDARLELEGRFEGRVTLDGSLTRLDPPTITLEQIVRANRFDPHEDHAAAAMELRPAGDLLVRSVHGRATEEAGDARASAPPGYPRCSRSAEYTAEWWIDRACLGRYGMRSLTLGPVQTRCCAPNTGEAPSPCVNVP